MLQNLNLIAIKDVEKILFVIIVVMLVTEHLQINVHLATKIEILLMDNANVKILDSIMDQTHIVSHVMKAALLV